MKSKTASVGLLDQYGKPLRIERHGPEPEAGYDIAKTTKENQQHWHEADGLAPNAQLQRGSRQEVANRSRYEAQNNSYMAGLIRTLVGDTVGTGPRLQMMMDQDLNESLEALWRLWSSFVNLALSYRILAGVKYIAGESFAVFRESKKLDKMGLPVALDLRLIDPLRVADGLNFWRTSGEDGVDVDDEGEVVAYRIWRNHPGDLYNYATPTRDYGKADVVPVENVIHWFQPEWPEQYRGVTPLAPALDAFARIRRFTKATLSGAEFQASVAGVLESELGIDQSEPVTKKQWFDTTEFVRGMLLTLPNGVKAKFPEVAAASPQYEAFVKVHLREAGRCINVPYGKIAGDHSSYNYSSGRMDDGPYWHDRDIERQEQEAKIYDRVFYKFADFAREALPAVAMFKGKLWELKHGWHYDAKPSSDPVKDASGDEKNLANVSDSAGAIAIRDGTTFEAICQQRARDIETLKRYNLPLPAWAMDAKPPTAPGAVATSQNESNTGTLENAI